MQKARRQPIHGASSVVGLRPLVGAWFQVLLLPTWGSSHLSLTVLVRYRSRESI